MLGYVGWRYAYPTYATISIDDQVTLATMDYGLFRNNELSNSELTVILN